MLHNRAIASAKDLAQHPANLRADTADKVRFKHGNVSDRRVSSAFVMSDVVDSTESSATRKGQSWASQLAKNRDYTHCPGWRTDGASL